MKFNLRTKLSKSAEWRLSSLMSPARIIVTGFAAIILFGTILLMLPISSAEALPSDFTDSLFTATSATCVTGLVIFDTVSHWSMFGQIVILVLVQIGGIGFMSFGLLISLILGKRVSPKTRLVFVQSMNLYNVDGVFRLVKKILTGTLVFELLGAVVLSFRFVPLFGVGDGIYKSIFTSVSAFCNGGFDLFGKYGGAFSSMRAFYGDPVVIVTISCLVIIGGLGFIVWDDISKYIMWKFKLKRERKKPNKKYADDETGAVNIREESRRLSVYTKLVLIISLILIIFGAAGFFLLERDNPGTIGKMSSPEKVLSSYFHSVTSRTTGFSMVRLDNAHGLTKLMIIILMFIGGSSGSCAGGIKTVTFGLIIISMFQFSRGNKEVSIFKRSVKTENILRAMTVASYGFVICFLASLLLVFLEGAPLEAALFEAVSAFSTAGISFSLTPTLCAASKYILVLVMMFGRVGIMTFAFAVFMRMSMSNKVNYVETNLFIG